MVTSMTGNGDGNKPCKQFLDVLLRPGPDLWEKAFSIRKNLLKAPRDCQACTKKTL